MAIIGVPINNGDGTYTFQTDMGEPLTLRGDAAEQAFRSRQAAPQSTAPVTPSQELVEAAQPPTDQRTADASDIIKRNLAPTANPGATFGPIASGPAPISPEDKRAINPGGPQGKSADVVRGMLGVNQGANPLDAQATPELRATLAQEAQAAEGKRGQGGAVFYKPPQQAAPGRAVGGGPSGPGKPVPVQQTIQGTQPMTPEQEMDAKRAAQGRYEAASGITDVEQKRSREMAEVRAQQVQDSKNAEMEMQARNSERERVVGQKLAKIDQLAQDAASDKIDPNHFWADKDASVTFAAAILQGIAGYSEAMGGGKAYAITKINEAIDRDMKAQDMNLRNKRESLQAQVNLLGQLRQEFGDKEAAAAAFRATKLATAGAQLEEINARNLPEEQKAKLAEFAAGLNADYTNLMRQAGQLSFSRTERFGGGPGGPSAKDLLADAKGYGSDVEAAKLNEAESSIANVERVLRENKGKGDIPGVGTENMVTRGVKATADFVAGHGSGEKLYYSKEERANRQALEYTKADLRHAITGAGMSDTERSNLDSMISSASTYSDIANTAKIIKQRVLYHKANLAGGHMPEAVELYEARRGLAHRQTDARPGVKVIQAGGAQAYREGPTAAASRRAEFIDEGAETTKLTPEQEREFQAWVKKMGIRDVDHPDSHYDYRGAFLAGMKPSKDAHWEDRFKQSGHETFSNESQYARPGENNFGYWDGDKYVRPLPPADLDEAIRRARADTGSHRGGR